VATPHQDDMSPEALLARAAKARGDVFPEWKLVAHTIPRTYDLIGRAGSYLHQYHGEAERSDKLSAQMRELIATPALCAKIDMRHAANHVRRMYRLGMTNRVIFEGATAFCTVSGWSTLTFVSLAIEQANSADYAFGSAPGGEPKTLTPFPELAMGRKRVRPGKDRLLDSPEWRYGATVDAEMTRRCAALVEHCLAEDGAKDALLGPGPRALIVVAALCMRGERELAAQHMRRAYDYGMTRLQVLDAISSALPMSGMTTAQIGLQAMQQADRAEGKRRKGKAKRSGRK
jgi:alkylhydroperoxidase/carboxymuconolactone decarboxylase family protein YurZ